MNALEKLKLVGAVTIPACASAWAHQGLIIQQKLPTVDYSGHGAPPRLAGHN